MFMTNGTDTSTQWASPFRCVQDYGQVILVEIADIPAGKAGRTMMIDEGKSR